MFNNIYIISKQKPTLFNYFYLPTLLMAFFIEDHRYEIATNNEVKLEM